MKILILQYKLLRDGEVVFEPTDHRNIEVVVPPNITHIKIEKCECDDYIQYRIFGVDRDELEKKRFTWKEFITQHLYERDKLEVDEAKLRKIKSEAQSARDRLRNKLNSEERAIFDEYLSKTKELASHEARKYFNAGFDYLFEQFVTALEQDPRLSDEEFRFYRKAEP
jgi:hypothetical protein